MGEAEAAAGNYGAAAQCFESALAQKPNDLETMLAYARLHAKRPNGFASAEKLLEQACEAHPKSASPFILLGWAVWRLARPRPAAPVPAVLR